MDHVATAIREQCGDTRVGVRFIETTGQELEASRSMKGISREEERISTQSYAAELDDIGLRSHPWAVR
jgi:hypothetical protein